MTSSQRAILEACVELFADRGYTGTSVRDIADLVGIKAASLYKSFKSKQAMLDALSDLGHAEFGRQQLASVLAAGDDPRDQLSASTKALVLMTCQYPRLSRIVNSEVRYLSPAAFERDRAARRQSAGILHDVLARGEASGVFRSADFASTTVLIWGLVLALASWYPYAPDEQAEKLADSYAEMFLGIVGTRDRPHA